MDNDRAAVVGNVPVDVADNVAVDNVRESEVAAVAEMLPAVDIFDCV